jgi:uncharacterized FlgJ-related protein
MILGVKPLISEVILSQLVSEQDWGKTRMKTSKNYNNVFGEECLAHIRIIVVYLGGKLTYVLFYATMGKLTYVLFFATMELHQRRYAVIFRVFILFCY